MKEKNVEDKAKRTETEYLAQISELEKTVRKRDREISRLAMAIEQEKIFANAKANILATHTIAQRIRDHYLQLLLDNSMDIIICFDQSERIVFCSSIMLKMTGVSDGSESGKTLDEFLKGFWDDAFISFLAENLSAVLAGNEPRYVPAETCIGGDELRKLLINFIPMISSETGNEGAITVFHDVTDIQRAREDAERAREDAERASAAKSEFLSNMSHEIRTPMNAIIGMTVIGKTSADMEQKDYCFRRIEGASSHLLGIINDILDMSKIEANKLELSPVEFDFERMLRKVVNIVGFRMDEKKQQFKVHIDSAIPKNLIGDDQRMAQIITNLIWNAIKFTPDGGLISLSARFLGEEKNTGEGSRCTIQIEVADTGIGISPQQQSRLFMSFAQAESGTTRKFGGTGLGLVISKSIVEMMDGRIWVESELDKGSTFAFTVKMERGQDRIIAASEAGSQQADGLKHQGSQVSFEGKRILLAEDVEINREIVLALLEPTKLEIDCAENGAQAVQKFSNAQDRYDMIFMDLQMPQMDGLEATRRIRALATEKAINIPIVAMTANVFREDVEQCLAAGMDGHVGKPISIEEVHRQLLHYLGE